MTTRQIEMKQSRVNLPFELAKKIRALLDAAKAEAKMSAEDWHDLEGEVLELVAEEG